MVIMAQSGKWIADWNKVKKSVLHERERKCRV